MSDQYVVVTRFQTPGKAPVVHTYGGPWPTKDKAKYRKARLRQRRIHEGDTYEVWVCKMQGDPL